MARRQTRHHMYVALQDDDRISIFTMNPATGALSWQEDVAVAGGPAPLAIAPDRVRRDRLAADVARIASAEVGRTLIEGKVEVAVASIRAQIGS